MKQLKTRQKGKVCNCCEGEKAEYSCPECKLNYCQNCASISDYTCGCVEPPQLKEIRLD